MRNQVVNSLVWLWWVINLERLEFKSGIVLFCFVFLLPLFHLENRICLSRSVQVVGAACRVATTTVVGVGDLIYMLVLVEIGVAATRTMAGARSLELLLLLLRWCLPSLYAYFFWDRSYACDDFLNVLYSLMPILAYGYLLVILLWSPYMDSLLFCMSCHGDRYNCSNTCLYALWSTLILILMHSISFFFWFVFDEFIAKVGEYGHKVVRTLC
jgi:hypothetical protein